MCLSHTVDHTISMQNFRRNISLRLLFIFFVSIVSIFIIEKYFIITKIRADSRQMEQAAYLAEKWFVLVEQIKKEKGIFSELGKGLKYGGLLGAEYSEITTTLGSLEAKETVLNPNFAALIVRLLHEASVDSNSVIGINLSSSFPTLAISVYAAIQTIKGRAVVVSSLGSSSYGANQPGATWIDMERWLHERGGLQIISSLVTLGAEGDSGGGLPEEGISILKNSTSDNGINIFIPKSIIEAIDMRVELFRKEKINILINIGGNQASLGNCSHSLTIPNGYHTSIKTCRDLDRGIIMRLSEKGIPFINLLNVKSLAARYRMPLISNGGDYYIDMLYNRQYVHKIPCFVALFIIVGLVLLNRKIQ